MFLSVLYVCPFWLDGFDEGLMRNHSIRLDCGSVIGHEKD